MEERRYTDGSGLVVKRKPLPIGATVENGIVRSEALSDMEALPQHLPDLHTQRLPLEDAYRDTLPSNNQSFAECTKDMEQAEPGPSKWKTAFDDVKHLAGGLISHPYESTKHYSILRHSHGLVYYDGLNTNVAITIFSDAPLPPDRSLWLQKKGWSGKAGLKVGAILGSKSAWINVTPTTSVDAAMLPRSDERAWQRDMKKLIKKSPKTDHQPCETDVIRIPHLANDGYFRIVLCTGKNGKKLLCPSPVFRLASLSASPSLMRGASLRTLPLEAGIKIGSFVASNTIKTHTANALQPVTTAYQNAVAPYKTQIDIAQQAATTAYHSSGAAEKVTRAIQTTDEEYSEVEDLKYTRATMMADTSSTALMADKDDAEPSPPFPVRFTARVIRGTGDAQATVGLPTANLANINEDTLLQLSGVYMAWVSIAQSTVPSLPKEMYNEFYQAVVSVTPCWNSTTKAVLQKSVKTYPIQDFEGLTFFDAKLSVMLMAYIRPSEQGSMSAINRDTWSNVTEIVDDIAITQASLDRPAWSSDLVLEKIKSNAVGRSFTERAADLRLTA